MGVLCDMFVNFINPKLLLKKKVIFLKARGKSNDCQILFYLKTNGRNFEK